MRPTPTRIVLALAALLASPLVAGETADRVPAKTAAPAAGAAMRAHVDPATGQDVTPRAGASRSTLSPALAESEAPLHVEQGKTKSGGKMVRLDGRFMVASVATVGPDGKAVQRCVETHAAPEGATARAERR